jgi:hypothetical protein
MTDNNSKIKIQRIGGANIDVDLTTQNDVSWKQGKCPWNVSDKSNFHRCAIKNTSICDFFCGIEPWDTVLCSYPKKIDHNKLRD